MNDEDLVAQAAQGDALAIAELQQRVCARRRTGPPICWPESPTDEQLMVLYYLWDDQALTNLRSRREDELLGYAHRQLRGRVADANEGAREAVQLVWLDVCRTRKLARNRWTGPRPVQPWLCAILRNRCESYLRSQGRTSALSELDPPAPGTVADGHALRVEDRVWRAMDRLEPADREVLQLRYWDDLEVGEIAEKLGLSKARVYAHLEQARQRLESFLDQ